MKYLGLDISSNVTGWATTDESGSLLEYGTIKTVGSGMSKLTDFYFKINNLLSELEPDWVCIEDTYISNAKTIRLLSYYAAAALLSIHTACGANDWYRLQDWIDLRAKKKGFEPPKNGVYFCTALEALKAVGCEIPKDRDDKKIAAIDWVNKKYNMSLERKDDDVADAIILSNVIRIRLEKKDGLV